MQPECIPPPNLQTFGKNVELERTPEFEKQQPTKSAE
jgi:hypothetical protein